MRRRSLSPALLATLVCFTIACEREDTRGLYDPGGKYFQRLDARGRKHMILDQDGEPLGKVRLRKDSIKVYDTDMVPVGTVKWSDETLRVEPWGGDAVELVASEDAVREIGDRLRLEKVEHGWALFGSSSQPLGYAALVEEDRLGLRDDYSAAPRAYARRETGDVKSPTGKSLVTARPPLTAPLLLPFAIDVELPILDRVALGVWLDRFFEEDEDEKQ